MVDIDYGKITVFVGNYDFWCQSIILARNLRANENKKKEQKSKDLESFIRRFSANASKSKQATSRRKQLENITLEDIPRSVRKKPYIVFEQKREAGEGREETYRISSKDARGKSTERRCYGSRE